MGIKTWSLGLGKGLAWLWIFPAVGALLLSLAAGAWVLGQRFEARALKAEGVVTALRLSASRDSNGRTSNTYCPVVNYQTADGQGIEFAGSTCARPPSYEVGERVRVLYEADAPYQASLDGFAERWLMTLILGSIGTVFALIGAAFVVPNLRRGRRAGELYQTGRPVQARVVEVARNRSLTVNGDSPWRIHAQWQDPATRKVHVFKSENLWFDPTPFLTEETLRVFIDPRHPKRYVVDTRLLPEPA